jgi:hypothetical protein
MAVRIRRGFDSAESADSLMGSLLPPMKMIFGMLLLLLSPVVGAEGQDLPIVVADSGSKAVDELVAGLVSRRPAPWRTDTEVPEGWGPLLGLSGRYATAEVETAIRKLQELGPSAFPHLLKHLDDDRYSYSDDPFISGIRSGWMNHTVGEAVDLVLTNELSWVGGYKLRGSADGKTHMPLTIEDYIKTRGGMEAWVAAVKDRTRVAVFTEFIDWCVAEEKKRGFESKEDEDLILGRYLEERKKIEKGGKE